MKIKYTLTLLLTGILFSATVPAIAQDGDEEGSNKEKKEIKPTPVRKFYWSNGLDASIFSTSIFERPGLDRKLTTLRFTTLVNFGFNFNYDFDEHFGIFTGIGIKNIGLIEKIGDSTIKRRVYTLGVPLGFKLGNLQKRNFGFVGGGVDMPFNYREKGFVKRRDKEKMSEWFGDQTERFMPFIFAGMSFNPGVTLKVQYYPGNFFNTEYEQKNALGIPYRPFRGYEAHLLYLSVGFDIHYKQKERAKDTDDEADDTNEM